MPEARMTIGLEGRTFRMAGAPGAIADAVAAALRENRARMAEGRSDILVAAYPLVPETGVDRLRLLADAEAMVDGGRIVVLLSAIATVPMRRHPDYSAVMAGAQADIRGLAMQLAPRIAVNAVACGLIEGDEGEVISGDAHMLTHVPLGHAGSIADITDAVLFLCDPLNTYTTGQTLAIDGGWSVGYGRNF